MLVNKKGIWFSTFFLIIIEQGIKLIINNNYLDSNLPIIPPWIYFKPMYNRDYSWFNSMLQLGVGKWMHIAVVSLLLVFLYLVYRFLNRKTGTGLLTDSAFSFIFAGAACSLIDKVFWDGSLDYILIKGFFTFDLKDVYINVFLGLLLLMVAINYQGIRDMDDSKVTRAFVDFILGRKHLD